MASPTREREQRRQPPGTVATLSRPPTLALSCVGRHLKWERRAGTSLSAGSVTLFFHPRYIAASYIQNGALAPSRAAQRAVRREPARAFFVTIA